MAIEKTIKLTADTGDALKQVDELKQGVKATDQAAVDSKKGFDKMKGGVSAVGLAFKALGIGLIVAAFVKLKDMLGQNQVIMDKVSVVTESLGFVFQKVVNFAVELGTKMTKAFTDPKQAIADLWTALKENIVDRIQGLIDTFGALGKVIKGVFSKDLDLMKEGLADAKTGMIQLATGMTKVEQTEFAETIKNTVTELKKGTAEAIAYGKAITALKNEVKLAEANQRQLQLVYQKDAELQRQLRDDISLTFEERIEANRKLGEILDSQFAEEQALTQKKIDLAELELSKNKDNIDLQVALINAKTEMADLDERITGQRSEQLVNLIALEKEQQDAIDAQLEAERKLAEDEQKRLETEEAARQKEIAAAEAQAQKLIDIANKEAEEKKKIKEAQIAAVKAMEITAAQSMLGSLGQLAGEGTKMAKATALAQILINTAQSISGAIKAGAGLPFPANLGAIATGVASVLAGIASAKAIFKKVPGGDNPNTPDSVDTAVQGATGMGALTPNLEAIDQPTLGGSQPVQAFVIENDISNAQALQEELDIQATL